MDSTNKKEIMFQIKKAFEKAEKLLIITHKKPDGDALGSSCGLYIALKNAGKNVQMACVDSAPNFLAFLPNIEKLQNDFILEEYDTIIVLDCGAYYMSKYHEKYPNIFEKTQRTIINIDHHPSNDLFGTINLVVPEAASTSFLIHKLLEFLELKITKEIATCLLTGIYTDTGSFMHSNTTSEVYKAASELVKRGGKFRQISKECFQKIGLPTMKIWGKILSNIKINKEGVLMSVVSEKDLEDIGASHEDVAGIIDLMNSVPNTKFSLLLTEDRNGNVKGSFRTQREDINLSEIAGIFGGGGHKKAAGFTIPGRLEKEIRWKIVEQST